MVEYITFRVARQGFAMETARVRGLLPVHDMVALDRPRGWILGIAALRGADFPVVDLRGKLGIARGPRGRQPCIVVAEVGSLRGLQLAGFVADRISEVIQVRERDIRGGVIRTHGRPRRIFNPDLLSGEVEFSGLWRAPRVAS